MLYVRDGGFVEEETLKKSLPRDFDSRKYYTVVYHDFITFPILLFPFIRNLLVDTICVSRVYYYNRQDAELFFEEQGKNLIFYIPNYVEEET